MSKYTNIVFVLFAAIATCAIKAADMRNLLNVCIPVPGLQRIIGEYVNNDYIKEPITACITAFRLGSHRGDPKGQLRKAGYKVFDRNSHPSSASIRFNRQVPPELFESIFDYMTKEIRENSKIKSKNDFVAVKIHQDEYRFKLRLSKEELENILERALKEFLGSPAK